MVYRPSVRYPDVYEDYVKGVNEATWLDCNQIIRLALFLAAHSSEYHTILEKYKKHDVTLPQADWGPEEEGCWKNSSYTPKPKEEKKAEIVKVVNQGGIRYVSHPSPLPE